MPERTSATITDDEIRMLREDAWRLFAACNEALVPPQEQGDNLNDFDAEADRKRFEARRFCADAINDQAGV